MAKPSIKINYFYSAAYSILTMFLPLITAPYISRVVGAEGLGVYSYHVTVSSYFAMFALLGVNFYGNRCIAKVRDNVKERSTVFSEIYTLQFVISFLVIIFYLLYIRFFTYENKIIAVLLIFNVLPSMISVAWFFHGLEMFKLTVTRNFIIKGLTVICIFMFIKGPEDLWKYTLIMSIGTLVSEGYLIVLTRNYITFSVPDFSRVLSHVKPNIILFIPIFSVSIYRSMDKLMIKWFSDYEQLGYYTNVEKIITVCLGCITSLGQVMLPKMTHLLSTGEYTTFKQLLNRSFKVVTVIASAILFGILAVADTFVPFFFGNGYDACIPLLKLLALNLLMLAWGNVFKSEYLIPKEKDYIYIISVSLGAIVNFCINCLLIPRMAAAGAAIGTMCAEFISLLIIFWFLRKEISIKSYITDSIPYLVVGITMCTVVKNFIIISDKLWLNLLFQIIVGAGIYIILVFFFWYCTKDELGEIMHSIIHKILKKYFKIG